MNYFFSDEWNNYPLCTVLALTSAGKSTLLNAFTGNSYLPSSNLSCTSRPIVLMHQPNLQNTTVIYKPAITCNTKTNYIREENPERIHKVLTSCNTENTYGSLMLQCSFAGIANYPHPFLIQDTPGINDAMHPVRSQYTKEILKKLDRGLIIYITAAKLVGTHDEEKCLCLLREKMKTNPNIHWIVVLNSTDECSVSEIKRAIRTEQRMIQHCGLPQTEIYPISAISALLFRKVLNRLKLVNSERAMFRQLCRKYFWFIYPLASEEEADIHKFTLEDISQFLPFTGIFDLENAIMKSVNALLNEK